MGKMSTGSVKLNRDILEKDFYKKTVAKCLFFHLLLTANICESVFCGANVPVGARVTSLPGLAKELGFSVDRIRTGILTLKIAGLITVKRHPKFSVITVENWDSYQLKSQSKSQSNSQSKSQKNEEDTGNEEDIGMNKSPSDDWIQNWKANL